jgi:DNA-directed RNA polymerase
MSKIDEQMRREADGLAYGVDRYMARVYGGAAVKELTPEQRAEDGSIPKQAGHVPTKVGENFVASLIADVAAEVGVYRRSTLQDAGRTRSDDWKTLEPFMSMVTDNQLALLTLRVALGALTEKMGFPGLCVQLGGMVEEHCRWTLMVKDKERAGYFNAVSRRIKTATSEQHQRAVVRNAFGVMGYDVYPEWSQGLRAKVGAHLLNRLVKVLGENGAPVFKIREHKKRGRGIKRLVADASVLEGLRQDHEGAAELGPLYTPMLVEPNKWSQDQGGFLNLPLPMSKNVEGDPRPDLAMQALNRVQGTAWHVNEPIYELVQELYESKSTIAGLPEWDDLVLPRKPRDIATNEPARKAWKRKAAKVYEANAKLVSKRMAVLNKLSTCRQNLGEDMYFVHQLDWRGRMYPVASHLSPQDDDLGRALLQFAEGKPLGDHGAYWLAVHLANSWGFDKVSLDERVQWTIEHRTDICNAATNPMDNRWWTEADKPWTFLAACHEWMGYCDEGVGYVSHLPIHVDGSCNGLQHFAAMLRDRSSAAAVNLVPQESPADIYTQVADRVNVLLAESVEVPVLGNDQPMASFWFDEGVDRKLVKRPVMTTPYGVTAYGMRNQVREILDERVRTGALDIHQDDIQKHANFVADLVHAALGDVIGAAHGAMEWLQECARVFSKVDQPIQWTTPVGLEVTQFYRVMGTERVAVKIGGQRIRVDLAKLSETLDAGRQEAGIAPNFVHSMDAAHLMMTVLALEDVVDSFTAVHDSYGCLAADMDELAWALRGTFVQLYSDDVLQDLAAQFREQLPRNAVIPDPPAMGDWAPEEVMEAEYFFA